MSTVDIHTEESLTVKPTMANIKYKLKRCSELLYNDFEETQNIIKRIPVIVEELTQLYQCCQFPYSPIEKSKVQSRICESRSLPLGKKYVSRPILRR